MTCLLIFLSACTLLAHLASSDLQWTPVQWLQFPTCCDVNTTKLWKKSVHSLDPTEQQALFPYLNYEFLLPKTELRSGLSHYGSAIRLKNFAVNLIEGKRPMKAAVLGASISKGQGARLMGKDDWFSLFSEWLKSVAKTNITTHNGCVPGTPSAYMELCLHNHVDPDVDLVFVEYCLNDGFEDKLIGNRMVMSMERLLRRILDLPGKPAVVMMQVANVEVLGYAPFYASSEDVKGVLTGYYDVQSLSLRTALWELAVLYPEPGFEWSQTMIDRHPSNVGHKIMADLAVHLIQSVVLDLQLQPLTAAEQHRLTLPLPLPMYQGNLPPVTSSCVVGGAFRSLVLSAPGWVWVNEGTEIKPKWGYVAHSPGSTLVLRVDTVMPHMDPSESIIVMIYYLQSYTPMGVARIECVAGCTCEPFEVDAWHPDWHVSETMRAGVRTSQGPQCNIAVTLLDVLSRKGTVRERHKFKVSGVAVTDWTKAPPGFGMNIG